jgi:antitoxin (DNA-binding transcriptional repressor) of toxin-antitoxin stability system
MKTVNATELKRNLSGVLDLASVREVAIERHGRVVAYLVPARKEAPARRRASRFRGEGLARRSEERLLDFLATGDLRPSRWRRAGEPRFMAGLAAFLGSVDEGDRHRLFALAEQLLPGASKVEAVRDWLHESGVDPSRFLPMLAARRAEVAEAAQR